MGVDIVDFLRGLDADIIMLIVGILMLLGSFATINSIQSSKFDHDLALLLLIMGLVCIGFGVGVLDASKFKAFLPTSGN